jgi:hypothetical protein
MIIESILLMSMLCSNNGNQEKIVENKSVQVNQEKPAYEKMGIPRSVFLNILHGAEKDYPNNYSMQNFRIKSECQKYLENQQLRRGL